MAFKREICKKIVSEPEKINLGSHFISLINEMWHYYTYQINECHEHFSEEAVHDLRVCIRRFLSLNSLINQITPNQYFNDIKSFLKNQIKNLSRLRDAQVQILIVKELRLNFPELNLYYYDLLRKEEKLVNRIRENIDILSSDELEGNIFFLKLHINRFLQSEKQNFDSLKEIIKNQFESILKIKDNIVPENPNTIHRLRLAFKEYRYILEHLQGLFNLSDKLIANLRKYQTYMGNIQDYQVLYIDISKFAKKQGEIPLKAFESILLFIDEKKVGLINEFMNNSDMIYEFNIFNGRLH